MIVSASPKTAENLFSGAKVLEFSELRLYFAVREPAAFFWSKSPKCPFP